MENRVGFGKRLGALILDIIVISIVGYIIASFVLKDMIADALATAESVAGDPDAVVEAAAGMMGGIMDGIMAAMAAYSVAYLLIFLMEGLVGYSPGKLMLGIRIGTADGKKAGIDKLMIRYAIKNANSILGVIAFMTGMLLLTTIGNIAGLIWFIGCFFVLGASKQGLHDMIAKTAVYPKGELT